ncbi:MAG: sigma-E factor negative regulatory protein RseB [Kangiellaceae bacterium]|jgi:sigma-E factor negative regulatory protein RseB
MPAKVKKKNLMKVVITRSNMTQKLAKKQPPVIASLAAVFLFTIALALSQTASAMQAAESSQLQIESPTAIDASGSVDTNIPVLSQNDGQDSDLNTPKNTLSTDNDFDALSAHAWMRRLANTIKQASFEISFVVTSAQRETMPYIWRHAKLENGDFAEQLSLLNGPGFEQIRINNKLSIFEPGFAPLSIRASTIDGPIPHAFTHRPDLLNAGYEVLLMGRNRVSGRMAQQIRVISRDKSRYQYHLWLDEQTGLLLKLNMYDLQGALLEQIQVTQLSINEDVQQHFVNIQADQMPPVAVTQSTLNQQLPWTLGYMPVGMQTVTENLRRISLTGKAAEYMMVSDGLVDVSIYVMKATDVAQEDIAFATDATSIVSISDGRIQVTVVGEIPLETASKMANSIVLINDRP